MEITSPFDFSRFGYDTVQPALARRTMPKMREYAQGIKKGATARVSQHPSGLWRDSTGVYYNPRYYMQKRGDFWYQVHDGGGTVSGRAKRMIEFARRPHSTSGRNLIKGIDQYYPRPGGGRVLWAEYDEQRDALAADFAEAVEQAAADIQKEVGGVG